MKARFDAGTDVAMVGAWDVERGAQPFSPEESKRLSEALDADAAHGHLFVLHTGADGGGPVDVYIDEPAPNDVLGGLTPVGDALVLAIPSGQLIVDGVEYYRSKKPDAARASRAVAIPAGDYLLHCYTTPDESQEVKPGQTRDLEAVVGKDELRYYERATRSGCVIGLVLLLLFPILGPLAGWRIAFATTVVAVIGFFYGREWFLRRNARFARIREAVTAHRLGNQEPTFVLELRRIEDRVGRTGGSVSSA
ncbi:MAG TPA: hypothetical protein VL308_14540 [Gemmatimonadaceae bacterium]|jgi:hypothetical protein|nr:hypothetical protein [Gemmatimonadaceae bacterium]